MATQVLMPALSPTMTEGKLARWLKKEGDEVRSGDVIAEIETDKATMEVEAVDEGTLAKILVGEGTEGVAVNTPIAVLNGGAEAAQPAVPEPAESPEPPGEDDAAIAARGEVNRAPEIEVPEAADRPEADWGPTKATTVREALRDAMAAEMRADDRVFLLGEEVAQYQGAYKVSQGLLDEFGPRNTMGQPIWPPLM